MKKFVLLAALASGLAFLGCKLAGKQGKDAEENEPAANAASEEA